MRLLALVLLSSVPACFDPPSIEFDDPPVPDGGGGGGGGGGGNNPDPVTLPLEFRGIQPVNPGFPDQLLVNNHIAVGGTHEVTLELDSDLTELAVAYDADTIDPALLAIDATDGPHVTLHANGEGLDSLVITEPDTGVLFDYALYAMSSFSRAVPVGVEEGVTSSALFGPPAQSYVFAPGQRRIGVAYLNAGSPANRLVDTSAVLIADGATQTRWDEITLDATTVGTHSIALTIGGESHSVEFEVVDTADDIHELTVFPGVTCFGVFAHGAFLSGAQWTLELDGQPAPTGLFGPNCMSYDAQPHTLTASAAGQTITVTVPHQR